MKVTDSINQSLAMGVQPLYGNATAGVIADKDKEIEHLKQLLKEKEANSSINE